MLSSSVFLKDSQHEACSVFNPKFSLSNFSQMYQTIVTQVIDPAEYSATVTDNLINKYKLRYPEGQ